MTRPTTSASETAPLLNEEGDTARAYSSTSCSASHTQPSPSRSPSSSSFPVVAAPETRYCSTLLLENKNSVARDHLASERTFLAYVRSCLAIASAGIALSQLLLVHFKYKPPVGIGSLVDILAVLGVVLGLCVLKHGHSRYFTIQAALTVDKFPADRAGVTIIAVSLAVLVIASFLVLVIARGESVI